MFTTIYLINVSLIVCACASESGKQLADNRTIININGTNENNLTVRFDYLSKSLIKLIPGTVNQIEATLGNLYQSIVDPVSIPETIKSRSKRQSGINLGLSFLRHLNWRWLIVKIIKTLFGFIIDAAATSILGKAAISSPLNIF